MSRQSANDYPAIEVVNMVHRRRWMVADGHTVIAVSNPADAMEENRRRVYDMDFVDLRPGDEICC